MKHTVIIDGNNLLFAMHEHGPTRPVGRVTLVRMIERWAIEEKAAVILVFDGPPPHGGLAKQIASKSIEVRFSGSKTADEDLVDLIEAHPAPARLRVITSDNAIRREAKHRKCRHVDNVAFILSLFESRLADRPPIQREASQPEKPTVVSPDDVQHWMDMFPEDDDPFGHR